MGASPQTNHLSQICDNNETATKSGRSWKDVVYLEAG